MAQSVVVLQYMAVTLRALVGPPMYPTAYTVVLMLTLVKDTCQGTCHKLPPCLFSQPPGTAEADTRCITMTGSTAPGISHAVVIDVLEPD